MKSKRLLILLLLALLVPWAANAQTLTVHDGSATSAYVPFYGYFADYNQTNQMIYPATELADMSGKVITKMVFYWQEDDYYYGNSYSVGTWTISLGETTATTLSGLDNTTSLTQVFTGVLDEDGGLFNTTDYTLTIEFDDDYVYNGGNLLVQFAHTGTGEYEYYVFKGENVTGASYCYNSQRNFLPKTTFTYETPAACPKPTGLAINYTGGTTATVTWNGNASSYNIDVNGTVTPNVTSPYPLSDLDYASTYTVKVQADCGTAGSSEWAEKSFATNLCADEDKCQISYSLQAKEYDNSYYYGWYNSGIKVIDVVTNEQLAFLTVPYPTYSSTGTVTGNLSVCDGRKIRFEWYCSYSAGNDNLLVDSYAVYDVNGGEIISGNGPMTETYIWMSDCTVTDCRKPTNLAVSEIGPHSVKLSWTENGPATEWQICLNGDMTHLINAPTNPYTLTGLDPDTRYTVKVLPVCDVDRWSDDFVFTTNISCPKPTDLSVTPYPFSADVTWEGWAEAYNIEWAEATATRDGIWLQYDDDTPVTRIGSTTNTWRSWGVRYPAEMLEGNNTLTKVAFYENADNYSDTTSCIIKIYTGNETQPETLVGTENVTCNGTTGLHEITLSSPIVINPAQSLWIIMTVYGKYVMTACQVNNPDNQWWDDNSDGVFTNMGEDNPDLAGFGWMIRGYVEGYDPTAYEWNTATGVTSPYTIPDLDSEKTYFVKVKALCGGEDGESNWTWALFTTPSNCSDPNTLNTTEVGARTATLAWVGYQTSYNLQYRTAERYVPVWEDDFENGIGDDWTIVAGENATHSTAGIWYAYNPSGLSFEAHSGSNCASSWSWASIAYTADNWLITPQVELGGIAKYYVRTNPGYPDNYEVLLSTTTADTTNFTVTLKAMAPAPAVAQWTEVIIDLSEYAGQQGYIAFHHVDYNMNYLLIDDFGIYTVEAAGRWNDAVATGTTLPISGLAPETEYEWHVQGINANCTGGVTGWSEIATFTTTPSCLVPTNFDVTNITANSAVVTCVSNATSFDIEVNGTVTEGVTIPHTLTLSPNSYYTVRVRANCGVEDGYSEWTSGISFSTPCVAITEYPYQMNFDSYTAYEDELPDCWSRISTSEYYGDYPYIIESGFNSKPNCLYFYSYGYSYYDPQDEYAILPEMDNLAGKQITLQAKTDSYYGTGTLSIGVMTEPTNVSTFVAIAPEQVLTGSYEEYVFDIPADATGNYIAIMMKAATNYNDNYLYVDDITIDVPPTCPKPTDFKVTATTTTTATFSWTENGTATAWQIMLDDDEDNLIDVAFEDVNISNDTVSYILPGLTSGTNYTAKVRANCGGTDGVSYWSNEESFATLCEAVTTFPWTEDFEGLTENYSIPACWDNDEGTTTNDSYKWCFTTDYTYGGHGNTDSTGYNGLNCVRFNSYTNSDNNTNFLKTATLSLPADTPMQLTFWYKNPAGGDFSVYISTDGGATHTTALDENISNVSTWTKHPAIDLSAYAGQEVVIVFKGTSNYGNGDAYIYLDDVTVAFIQTIELVEGWNWISTNLEVSDPFEMLQALETALGDNATLIEHNGATTEYLGSGFWFGTLEYEGMTNDKMYLVHVSDSCTIELQGEPASTTVAITIGPGWNWIGFPSVEEMSITDFLSGFEAEVGDIIEHDGLMSEYLGYGFWMGLDTLVPGNGYLYYSNSQEEKTLYFQIGQRNGKSHKK